MNSNETAKLYQIVIFINKILLMCTLKINVQFENKVLLGGNIARIGPDIGTVDLAQSIRNAVCIGGCVTLYVLYIRARILIMNLYIYQFDSHEPVLFANLVCMQTIAKRLHSMNYDLVV